MKEGGDDDDDDDALLHTHLHKKGQERRQTWACISSLKLNILQVKRVVVVEVQV